MRISIFVTLLVTIVPALGQATPANRQVEHHLEALNRELAQAMVAHSTWCHKNRLYGQRNETYRRLLHLNPAHRPARRFLKHSLVNGAWVAPEQPVLGKDWNLQLLPEAESRSKKIYEDYCIKVLTLLDDPGSDLSDREVRLTLREAALPISPNSEVIRLRLGEAWSGSQWILEESLGARSRRNEMQNLATDLLEREVQVLPADEPSVLAPIGIDWKSHMATPIVTVSGTTSVDEVARVARIAHASEEYFNAIFGTNRHLPVGYGVVLLSKDEEKNLLIDNIRGPNAKQRAFLRRLGGAWLPQTQVVVEWHRGVDQRADGALRQSLARLLGDEFNITKAHGWIWEGFGILLTDRMLGTRLTYFVQDSGYTPESHALRDRLLSPRSNWLQEARTMMEGASAPKLQFVLGRNVNQMSMQDCLYSYALAAYLLDGRPLDTAPILRGIGKGEHPVEVMEQVLRIDLQTLQERLLRWLQEAG